MKTFVRLIWRYVLAAVGIVLLLLFSGVAVLGWLGWQESCRLPQREYSSSEIADSMVETAEGLAFGAERTPQEWMNGYENSLGVHIRHLREKLEAEPGAPQFLRTVRGIGYKLTKGEEA